MVFAHQLQSFMSYWSVTVYNSQGSDTRVHTQKNLLGFLGYTDRKKNPPQKTHTLL